MGCCSDSPHQFPISLESSSFSNSLYPLLLLNDVKEGQKRISSLVIQQYDLENMGKKLGRFLFFFLLRKTSLLPQIGSLSIQAIEKNLHSLIYFLLTI